MNQDTRGIVNFLRSVPLAKSPSFQSLLQRGGPPGNPYPIARPSQQSGIAPLPTQGHPLEGVIVFGPPPIMGSILPNSVIGSSGNSLVGTIPVLGDPAFPQAFIPGPGGGPFFGPRPGGPGTAEERLKQFTEAGGHFWWDPCYESWSVLCQIVEDLIEDFLTWILEGGSAEAVFAGLNAVKGQAKVIVDGNCYASHIRAVGAAGAEADLYAHYVTTLKTLVDMAETDAQTPMTTIARTMNLVRLLRKNICKKALASGGRTP